MEIEFDFVSHDLRFRLSSGAAISLPLRPQCVADFYSEYNRCLSALDITVEIHSLPVEVANPIPFEKDTVHRSYDPEYAHRFWRVLMSVNSLFLNFSSDFVGKRSPVHFFWGSFDLAVTRFSGRPAPPRAGADIITREAYSHEVISAGFWPGNGGFGSAAFYCYAAPSPAGLDKEKVLPEAAHYDTTLGEFILKYEDALAAPCPETAVMDFLTSTYEAGARLAKWNRNELEHATPVLQTT